MTFSRKQLHSVFVLGGSSFSTPTLGSTAQCFATDVPTAQSAKRKPAASAPPQWPAQTICEDTHWRLTRDRFDGTVRAFSLRAPTSFVREERAGQVTLVGEDGALWGVGQNDADALKNVGDLMDRYVESLLDEDVRGISTLSDPTRQWVKQLRRLLPTWPLPTSDLQKRLKFCEQFWIDHAKVRQAYVPVQKWLLRPADLSTALITLAQYAPNELADQLLIALTHALEHPDPMVRESAVIGLSRFVAEPNVKTQLETLRSAEREPNKHVRQAVADVLEN